MTDQPSTQLTDDELKVVRSAAVRAGATVSQADPGFFDTFKESFAASKAVKEAPEEVRSLFTGGMPELPKGDPASIEARTLELLREAATILRAKAPALLDAYRETVLRSCRDVAEAAKGTSGGESEAITKIEQALA